MYIGRQQNGAHDGKAWQTPIASAASVTRQSSFKTLWQSSRRAFGVVTALACRFIPVPPSGSWVGFATPTFRGVRDVYNLLSPDS